MVLCGIATTRAQEPEFIMLAQRVSVSSLARSFPAIPFARWLAQTGAVTQAAIRWEVNDCGEGGDARTAPTCVEAVFNLASDATAHASLLLAARDGTPTKPAIYSLYALTGSAVTRFSKLPEWVAYVRGHRR
jgi:hypothetical protein